MKFFIDLVRGEYPEASMQDKIPAAENICDRAGLPRVSKEEILAAHVPIKMIDVRGWLSGISDAQQEEPQKPAP